MCRSISQPRFIMILRIARLSSPSAPAGRWARGWITTVIGETAISSSGVATIRVRPIGGMNLHVNETWGIRLFGTLTIIRAQLRQIVATGDGAGIRWCARRPRRSHGKHWHTRFHSMPNAQLAFPDPRQLHLHALHPSAGRHRTVRSLASTVRALREVIAIAASRACRRSRVPRQLRTRHPLLAAVATVAAVAAATVVVAGVNLLLL